MSLKTNTKKTEQTTELACHVAQYQKYTEFLLYILDNEVDHLSLGEVKEKFKEKFKYDLNKKDKLLNQYFGVTRIVPLMLIKQIKNNKIGGETKREAEIRIIRNAFAHGDITSSEHGFIFHAKKEEDSVKMSYQEFTEFVHSVENEFVQKTIDLI